MDEFLGQELIFKPSQSDFAVHYGGIGLYVGILLFKLVIGF